MEFENDVKAVVAEMAEALNKNYSDQKLFDLSLGERLPQKDEIIDFVDELRKVTFPGFFGRENMAYANKEYFAGHKLSLIYDKLFRQIKVALSYKNDAKSYQEITEEAQEKALGFIRCIPEVQALLCKDVEAEYNGDPAANSREEIIFSYPGLFAIFVYRYAHVLYQMKVPFIPRIMTEYAHGETGIVTSGAPRLIEISDRHSGKHNGLKEVLRFLGISMEETIAFGDGDNDSEMLAEAGLGVAVLNATERCKEAADLVIGDYLDDSVAEFLEETVR